MSVQGFSTVGIVGTGAIGASWATLLLAHGLDVLATDPAPGAEVRLRAEVVIRIEELRADVAPTGVLRFVPDIADVAAADFVFENGPERLDAKREIFSALDACAAPDVVLASSTSGLRPSDFQSACGRHPERVLVAHPFNPPHLMPLVEIVAGTATSEQAVEDALAFCRRLGKKPIRVRSEVPGHVANRLQAALWREAYHLVAEGVATVSDIDTAITAGPGLRWALLGPFATQHLSGGEGGLTHVLRHLGPPMVDWWNDLGQPELTPELAALLVQGVDAELTGRSTETWRESRDLALSELLALKERSGLS
jgi:carnitine 3-dehydrogenase